MMKLLVVLSILAELVTFIYWKELRQFKDEEDKEKRRNFLKDHGSMGIVVILGLIYIITTIIGLVQLRVEAAILMAITIIIAILDKMGIKKNLPIAIADTLVCSSILFYWLFNV